jgi:flavin reductase ActVB
MQPPPVELPSFRDAVARFASGVTVVTTVDSNHRPVGFTATAFSSLSLDPPLILVCLARTATSHAAFRSASTFAVSILSTEQEGVARRFATKGIDKFAGLPVDRGSRSGLPVIPDATAYLECQTVELLDGGDHTILVGMVLAAASTERPPLLYFNRRFGAFCPDHVEGADPPMTPAGALHR